MWTALLLVATAGVAISVVYVLGHQPKVKGAGSTPGFVATTSSSSTPAPSSSTHSSASASPSGHSSSSTSSSVPKGPDIAFLGDDYTIGLGATVTAQGFTALIGTTLNVSEKSVGSNGAGYATSGSGGQTYEQEVAAVVALDPKVVVVTGGRNDYLANDGSSVAAAAKTLFTSLRSKLPHAKIVVVSSFFGDSDHPAPLDAIDTDVKNAATAAGADYINLPDPLHGHPEWMANAAVPNNAGYQAIAAALGPKLQQYLS